MSTIKVNSIKNTSTDDGGIAIDNTGHVQVDGVQLPTAGPFSNRNLVVNGAMRVAQRGTSFAAATSDTYAADRWEYERSTDAVVTVSQETDAPPGYKNSIKAEITTADTSTAASAFTQFLYKIEANDISHLEYGTADAKTCTISFWAKHSLAGTYPFSVQNHNGSRVFPSSYTINTANTWEYKTITFAGDTGGTWTTNGNGLGIRFIFPWNMGSNFTGGTAGAWAATTSFADLVPTAGPDINGTVGNTVQWAGVQLEVGEKATPFEHRSYGDELAKCQRYFYKIGGDTVDTALGIGAVYSSTQINVHLDLPCAMRTKPSATTTGASNWLYVAQGASSQTSSSSVAIGDGGDINLTTLRLFIESLSSLTTGNAVWCLVNSNHSLDFSAEL